MHLSDGEKLVLMMLSDLHKHLAIESEIDPAFVSDAILSGNVWALKDGYPGVFHGSDKTPDVVKTTRDVLSMWSSIERSVEELSAEDRARLKAAAEPFGDEPRWRGFDGNEESEYMSAARFMMDQLDYFPDLADRSRANAHMPTLPAFLRMKPVYDQLTASSHLSNLDVAQLIAILTAQRRPQQSG